LTLNIQHVIKFSFTYSDAEDTTVAVSLQLANGVYEGTMIDGSSLYNHDSDKFRWEMVFVSEANHEYQMTYVHVSKGGSYLRGDPAVERTCHGL
jgi:hypothetical protein